MIDGTPGRHAADRSAAPVAGQEAHSVGRAESWGFVLPVTALYLLVVLVTLAHHEYWRDEIRALSVATATASLRALQAELRSEGHPSLWCLLLRAAHATGPSMRALALGLGIALAGFLFAAFTVRRPTSRWSRPRRSAWCRA